MYTNSYIYLGVWMRCKIAVLQVSELPNSCWFTGHSFYGIWLISAVRELVITSKMWIAVFWNMFRD
jgi:hypothetical protein